MKSNTYELHNYADLNMDSGSPSKKDSLKRKATSARGEKYSLRQKRQKRSASVDEELPDLDLELDSLGPATTSKRPKKSNSASKAKTKAPPLSKYRRKTANARERTRMREINTAFETLRHSVPQAITGEDAANASEKLTKITTLRLAMKYIQMLSDSMEDPSYEREFIGECLEESANREALVSVDTEPELEAELQVPAAAVAAAAKKPAKSKAASKKSATAASKRQTQKLAKQGPPTQTAATTTTSPMSSGESCYAASSIGSPGSCAGAACSPSSAYASLSSSASNISSSQRSPSSSQRSSSSSSSSPVLEPDGSLMGLQGLSELDTLLLESDAESLQCLSPGYEGLLSSGESILPCRGDMPMPGCLDKPDVELSLRMLDAQHSTDSFDFASDQQPSACISALDALDGCYPWGPVDLLHGDFSDIFLT